MRKKVFGKKLSRSRKSRTALLRSLVLEFVEHGSINTTLAKAKAVQPLIESLTKIASSSSSVSSKRIVLGRLANNREVSDKLFATSFPKEKKSGFTRILPMAPRKGDRAELARIEWSFEKVAQNNESSEKKTETKQVSSKSKKA